MQVKLNRLLGSNALVYGDFDFDLGGHSVYQLIGKNGSGKSSIPVIIEEILYNDNSRGLTKAEIPNRETGKTGWWGEIHFTVDEDSFVVRKDVKSSAKVVLSKNGEDISGHTATQTYATLRSIFGGLDFKTFSKLVYQSTDSSMDFLQATDAYRKKFLIELLGLEGYAEIEEKLKESKKRAAGLVSSLKLSIGAINSVLNTTSKREFQVVKPVPEEPVGVSDRIDEIKAELAKAAVFNKVVEETIKRNKAKQSHVRRLEMAKVALKKVQAEEPERGEDVRADIKSKHTELTQVETKMAGFKANHSQFKAASAVTHCKTCGSELDVSQQTEAMNIARAGFEELKPSRDRLRSELSELQPKAKAFENYETWKAQLKLAESEVNSLSSVECVEEVSGDLIDVSELNKELRAVTQELQGFKKLLDEVTAYNSGVLVNNAKVEEQQTMVAKMKVDLAESNEALAVATAELAEIEALCSAFGPKGIIAYKIESSVKVFEEMINEYLSEFTDGQFALGFELDSSKLSVVIYDDSVPVRMKALSSGEKNKVNVATLLAIRNMMAAISKVNINLLFLDEVISVLDQEARDTLVNILLKEEHLNSFLVSHGYTHPLTKAVRLVKRNKISEVVHD